MDASDKVSFFPLSFWRKCGFKCRLSQQLSDPCLGEVSTKGIGQRDEEPMSQHLSVRLAYALHVSASEMKGGVEQRNIYLHNPVFLLMKVGPMAGAHGDFGLSQTKDDHHGGHCPGSKMVDGL